MCRARDTAGQTVPLSDATSRMRTKAPRVSLPYTNGSYHMTARGPPGLHLSAVCPSCPVEKPTCPAQTGRSPHKVCRSPASPERPFVAGASFMSQPAWGTRTMRPNADEPKLACGWRPSFEPVAAERHDLPKVDSSGGQSRASRHRSLAARGPCTPRRQVRHRALNPWAPREKGDHTFLL